MGGLSDGTAGLVLVQGSGGGGTIGSITSTGNTLTITNSTGPIVNADLNLASANTWTAGITISQTASTGSPISAFTVNGAAHTALTASTEYTDVNFNLARTVQFATGALALERAVRIQGPTYSFVGASTITAAATLAITAPTAGTNATITNSYALSIESGKIKIAPGGGTAAQYGEISWGGGASSLILSNAATGGGTLSIGLNGSGGARIDGGFTAVGAIDAEGSNTTTNNRAYTIDVNGGIQLKFGMLTNSPATFACWDGSNNLANITAQLFSVQEGANKFQGSATLVAGTIAITISGITAATHRAYIQQTTVGGTSGALHTAVITTNTLTITGVSTSNVTQNLDTSTFNYWVVGIA